MTAHKAIAERVPRLLIWVSLGSEVGQLVQGSGFFRKFWFLDFSTLDSSHVSGSDRHRHKTLQRIQLFPVEMNSLISIAHVALLVGKSSSYETDGEACQRFHSKGATELGSNPSPTSLLSPGAQPVTGARQP